VKPGRPHIASLETLLLLASILLMAGAVATALGARAPRPSAVNTERLGKVQVEVSRSGQPAFTIADFRPGQSGGGTIKVANTGTTDGSLSMKQFEIRETLGLAGGRLSEVLGLRIDEVGADTVYRGPVASTKAHHLGRLAAGDSRRYRFTISLRDGGEPSSDTTGDNAYQGASLRTSTEWRLSQGRLETLGEVEENRDIGSGAAPPIATETDGENDALPFTGWVPTSLLITGLLALLAGVALSRSHSSTPGHS
jgi:hypothetical protein